MTKAIDMISVNCLDCDTVHYMEITEANDNPVCAGCSSKNMNVEDSAEKEKLAALERTKEQFKMLEEAGITLADIVAGIRPS